MVQVKAFFQVALPLAVGVGHTQVETPCPSLVPLPLQHWSLHELCYTQRGRVSGCTSHTLSTLNSVFSRSCSGPYLFGSSSVCRALRTPNLVAGPAGYAGLVGDGALEVKTRFSLCSLSYAWPSSREGHDWLVGYLSFIWRGLLPNSSLCKVGLINRQFVNSTLCLDNCSFMI